MISSRNDHSSSETISSKNCSLNRILEDLSVKASKALFSLKTNLNLMKMPIKLSIKIYDTMILPILLYGIEIWAPSGKFCLEKWDKTEIEKNHTSLLKQILGLNRCTQNDMVRAEFGRLPLLLRGHTSVWSYIKYLQRKDDQSLVKKAFQIDMGLESHASIFGTWDSVYIKIIRNI